MAQALDRRAPTLVPRLAFSMLATALVAVLVAGYLTLGPSRGHAGAAEFRAAALVAALTAVTCFVGAIVIVSVTRRMLPALWGYVPGLLAVLGGGLWLAEASRFETSDGHWWVGALVALNPLFWVPIWVGVTLALGRAARRTE